MLIRSENTKQAPKRKPRDEFDEKIAAANSKFAEADNCEAILAAARQVRAWLMKNTQITGHHGNPISNQGGWWPVGIDHTDDEARLDLRQSSLRKRLFGHGLRRLLCLLIEDELLPETYYDTMRKHTDFARMALWEELVGYTLSPKNAGKTLSLGDMVDRFELAPGSNASKQRDPTLLPLAELGLVAVRFVNGDQFAISLGVVGEIFHREVFTPVRAAFEPKIKGKTP